MKFNFDVDINLNVRFPCAKDKRDSAQSLVFSEVRYGDSGFIVRGHIDMPNIQMNRGQSVNLTVKPLAADGGPGAYQVGSAVWSDSNEFVSVTPVVGDENNELRRTVKGLGATGNTVVSLTLDADPSVEGTSDIVGTAVFVINQPNATTVDIEPDGPPA